VQMELIKGSLSCFENDLELQEGKIVNVNSINKLNFVFCGGNLDAACPQLEIPLKVALRKSSKGGN